MTDQELLQQLQQVKKQLFKWCHVRNFPANLDVAEQAKEEIPRLEKQLAQLEKLFCDQIMIPNFFKLLVAIEVLREKKFQNEKKGIEFAKIHADEMIRKLGIVVNEHLKCGDPKCPHKGRHHGEKLTPRKDRDGRWHQFVVVVRYADYSYQTNLCDLCANFRRQRGEKVQPLLLKKRPKSAAA